MKGGICLCVRERERERERVVFYPIYKEQIVGLIWIPCHTALLGVRKYYFPTLSDKL
jgi:hypothetical protein